jgi:TonB family protein
MNKGMILSLLVAGLITGSYMEFQVHLQDNAQVLEVIDVDVLELESVEWSPPMADKLHPPPPLPVPYRVYFFLKRDGSIGSAPALDGRDISEAPTFTPFTVAPSITNRTEVVQAMTEAYPPLLRDAGVSGTVRVYFFIQADGHVVKFQLDRPSTHEALNAAALRVSGVYRFNPAMHRDQPVAVWAPSGCARAGTG